MCPAHRNRGEISAVGRAAALLKEFRGGERSLGVSALARRTDLPKATVHRLLGELVRLGLLDRVDTGYRPGLLLFELGQQASPSRSLREAARPHMAVLHEATGHNVGLAVLQDRDVVYVEILRGRAAPRLPQRTGGRWPAHASCSGKAMLAHAPAHIVDAVLTGPLSALTPQTITDADALRRELERVRRTASAYDRRESFPTVVGVASPLFATDGTVVGALSMSGLAGRMNVARLDAAVRTTALAISRDLAEAEWVARPVLRRS